MFFDPALSGSGKLACASCHSPAYAYGPPNDLAVQLGGPDLKNTGLRAVPSLEYKEHTPNFTIGPNPSVPDTDAQPAAAAPSADVKVASVAKADPTSAAFAAAEAKVPQGGLDWDGRADTFQSQAYGPLLDPDEMDNRDKAALLKRIQNAPYAEDLKTLFGPNIFNMLNLVLDEALFALVRFQIEDPSFHPYSSKYDAYLAGKATLTAAEARGLKLFEDPDKGNCSSCHIDKPSKDGLYRPAFTDYQFEALGAPRNRALAVNRDAGFHDLGLCGPLRTDLARQTQYCGMFLTPTLRNVARRGVYFHNGVYHDLRDVLRFYNFRDTEPGRIYPRDAGGRVMKYDDLPRRYWTNVDIADAPFDRRLGQRAALTDAEMNDIIAFLETLDDGYAPDPR